MMCHYPNRILTLFSPSKHRTSCNNDTNRRLTEPYLIPHPQHAPQTTDHYGVGSSVRRDELMSREGIKISVGRTIVTIRQTKGQPTHEDGLNKARETRLPKRHTVHTRRVYEGYIFFL